jgi:hypothetical protein
MDGYEPVDNDIGDPNLPWMWHLPSLALLRFAYGSRTRMFITIMSIIGATKASTMSAILSLT